MKNMQWLGILAAIALLLPVKPLWAQSDIHLALGASIGNYTLTDLPGDIDELVLVDESTLNFEVAGIANINPAYLRVGLGLGVGMGDSNLATGGFTLSGGYLLTENLSLFGGMQVAATSFNIDETINPANGTAVLSVGGFFFGAGYQFSAIPLELSFAVSPMDGTREVQDDFGNFSTSHNSTGTSFHVGYVVSKVKLSLEYRLYDYNEFQEESTEFKATMLF